MNQDTHEAVYKKTLAKVNHIMNHTGTASVVLEVSREDYDSLQQGYLGALGELPMSRGKVIITQRKEGPTPRESLDETKRFSASYTVRASNGCSVTGVTYGETEEAAALAAQERIKQAENDLMPKIFKSMIIEER